jgi:hypothetical protein
VGYYYTASGLGTTVLNLFDSDGLGHARDSHGFYAQAMATFGKVSVGGSYGESRLNLPMPSMPPPRPRWWPRTAAMWARSAMA